MRPLARIGLRALCVALLGRFRDLGPDPLSGLFGVAKQVREVNRGLMGPRRGPELICWAGEVLEYARCRSRPAPDLLGHGMWSLQEYCKAGKRVEHRLAWTRKAQVAGPGWRVGGTTQGRRRSDGQSGGLAVVVADQPAEESVSAHFPLRALVDRTLWRS